MKCSLFTLYIEVPHEFDRKQWSTAKSRLQAGVSQPQQHQNHSGALQRHLSESRT